MSLYLVCSLGAIRIRLEWFQFRVGFAVVTLHRVKSVIKRRISTVRSFVGGIGRHVTSEEECWGAGGGRVGGVSE